MIPLGVAPVAVVCCVSRDVGLVRTQEHVTLNMHFCVETGGVYSNVTAVVVDVAIGVWCAPLRLCCLRISQQHEHKTDYAHRPNSLLVFSGFGFHSPPLSRGVCEITT